MFVKDCKHLLTANSSIWWEELTWRELSELPSENEVSKKGRLSSKVQIKSAILRENNARIIADVKNKTHFKLIEAAIPKVIAVK